MIGCCSRMIVTQRWIFARAYRIDLGASDFSLALARLRRGRGCGWCRGSCNSASLTDARDHRADLDRIAFLEQLLAERSGNWRRHLDRHFVGLKAGDRL